MSRIDAAILRAVSWLRAEQQPAGCWSGEWRCFWAALYGAALILDGEPAESEVLRDICDFGERCATPEGGFGGDAGEPADAYLTATWLPLITRLRPGSEVLPRARASLRRSGTDVRLPHLQMLRWICAPSERAEPGVTGRPSDRMTRLAQRLLLCREHRSAPPRVVGPTPGGLAARLKARATSVLIRHVSFATPQDPSALERIFDFPTVPDLMLLPQAALRRLAGDVSAASSRLVEHARERRPKLVFADGSYAAFPALLADLFFCRALGLEEAARTASRALRATRYRSGGWLGGPHASNNVFDTATTVLALLAAGVPKSDGLVRRAASWLKDALDTGGGMCSWAHFAGNRGVGDVDDTGAACLALRECGETAAAERAAPSLLALQESSGGFSTFDLLVRPNFVFVSTAARAVETLAGSGLGHAHAGVRRGRDWLLAQQQPDGSWIDGWFARGIYGTVVAACGLVRGGLLQREDPRVVRSVAWLLARQNADGGWGESFRGEPKGSTAEHTGLALQGLALASGAGAAAAKALAALESGAHWLLRSQRADGAWDASHIGSFGGDVGYTNAHAPVAWALLGLGEARRALAPPR